jgi:hypothetical protein
MLLSEWVTTIYFHSPRGEEGGAIELRIISQINLISLLCPKVSAEGLGKCKIEGKHRSHSYPQFCTSILHGSLVCDVDQDPDYGFLWLCNGARGPQSTTPEGRGGGSLIIDSLRLAYEAA